MTVHVEDVTMAELARRLFPESEPPDDHEKITVTVVYHATPTEIRKASERTFGGKPMARASSATIRVEYDEETDS